MDAGREDGLIQAVKPMGQVPGDGQRMFNKFEKALEGAREGNELKITLPSQKTFDEQDSP